MKAYLMGSDGLVETIEIGEAAASSRFSFPGVASTHRTFEAAMMDEIKSLLGVDEVESERLFGVGDVVFRATGSNDWRAVVVGRNQYGEWTAPEASAADVEEMLRAAS